MNLNKYHFFYWLFYAVFVVSLDYFFLGASFNIVRELVFLTIEICIFYSFLFAIVNTSGKSILLVLRSAAFYIGSFLIAVGLNYIRGLVAKYYGINILSSLKDLVYDTVLIYVHFAFYALGYFFAMRFGQKQKELSKMAYTSALTERNSVVLLNRNTQLQKDLLQSENNFLRAQINPHFLYNCLNFLYSKTFQQQPKVGEAIMMLSKIMRYSLTDFSASNGLANLDEEIEHIQNLIDINEFRFDHTLQIKFKVEGNPSGKKIAPMLLITLVENVFKHGNLQEKSCPAVISCKMDEADKTVHLNTFNQKNKIIARRTPGVGLSNIKQRLKLLYGDNFKLMETDEGQTYMAQLTLPYFE